MLRKFILIAAFVLPGALHAGSADPLAQGREAFVSALPGIARGETAASDSAALRAYPLYPYLLAERLQWSLARAEPANAMDVSIAAFLNQYGDAPWTRRLRSKWLRALAKRQDWNLFLANYLEPRADAALRCQALNAQIAIQPSAALIEPALMLWRNGSSMPEACTQVFNWLKLSGALDVNEIAKRARLALEAQNVSVANFVIKMLPAHQRGSFQQWSNVLSNPSAHLESALQAGLEPQAAIDGFAKIARSSPSTAMAILGRIERRCGNPCSLPSPGGIGEMRREIALNLTWSRKPETVDQFRLVPAAALDERGHEWRVRAALWAGEWNLAANWIAEMPAEMLEDPRWRYWRGRSAEKLGHREAADADYQSLIRENGYYSVLAAERLGQKFTPHDRKLPGDPMVRAQIAASPAMVRVREAMRVEQKSWAITEWKEHIENKSPQQIIEIARVLSDWGLHLLAVASATQAKVFDDYELLYPRPFKHELAGAAKRVNLPEHWVWGVLRQESLYEANARSSANARGLLQLLPTTARHVARRNGFPQPTLDDLNDPATNLLLGTAYLREQFDTFGGRFVLVLGAYNAGPGAVRRWLPEQPLETDVWVENVPFNETRSYIQRIIWHSTVFGWQSTGKAQRITNWLTPISSDLTPIPRAD